MSNKTQLQENNVKLQSLLNTINALPDPIPDDLGNATTDKVLKGYTFSSNNGIKLTGNMVLPIGLYLGNPPTKTVYQYNEPLTIEGMTVILKVWDGTQSIETDVTEDCTFTPEAGTLMTTVGFNQIKATYEYNGLTYTVIQDLEVENTLQSIAITSQPNKTEYRYNEGLDITGLVVTATYANEATADVTSLCTFDPAVGETFDGKGQQVVNVTYTEGTVEKTTQFTITVKRELVYYGTIDGLSTARQDAEGASVGNYALFAGGYKSPTDTLTIYNKVDAYSSELVRSNATAGHKAYQMAGASVGNYALFAGGLNSTGYRGGQSIVSTYNNELVKSNPTALSTSRGYAAGASVGNYALFAGGVNNFGSEQLDANYYANVDAYSDELVKTTATELSLARAEFAGASVGNYALFAGGYATGYGVSWRNTVDAYNSELVRSKATVLASGVSSLGGASVGTYALFAGGETGSGMSNIVNAYSDQLVRTTATRLSDYKYNPGCVSIGEFAIFAGGVVNPGYSTLVDSYNAQLVKTVLTPLAEGVTNMAGACAGDYALLAGGNKATYPTEYNVDTVVYAG